VGIHAQEQGTADALGLAVLAHGLGDGQDVGLVEALLQRRAAVAAGAEGHQLGRVAGVGQVEIGLEQGVDIDQVLGGGGLTCAGVGHGVSPFFTT
jgi:hypothetical protein